VSLGYQTTHHGATGAAVSCTTEQTVLGEGVRWDARRGELLRVDILRGRVYRDRVSDDGSLIPLRVYSLAGNVVRLRRSRATTVGCSPPTVPSFT
jgi:sugar lactone lactonase YvrE